MRETWSRSGSRRKSLIKNLRSGRKKFLRQWRYPAAKSNLRRVVAISTGIVRSGSESMLSTSEAREDSKLGLAAEVLRCHGIVRLKAWGTSMLPSVWPGDLLTIESAIYDELVPGDIVLVLRDKRFLVHRLVEGRPGRDCVCLITKGDAIPHNDPPAAASELLGRVVRIRRANRSFVPRQRVSRFHFWLAWTMFHWERFRTITSHVYAETLQAGRNHFGQFVRAIWLMLRGVPAISRSGVRER
jgi:hypothetical protein